MISTRLWVAAVWSIWMLEFKSVAVADPALTCNFTLNNLKFDLCSIFEADTVKIVTEEETPPTHTTNTYVVGLGGSLQWDGTLPEELQCPRGTWICLTVENTRPSHPSEPRRILQVVPVAGIPGLNPKSQMNSKENVDDFHAPLQVTLHGGSYNHQPQKASFQFHCDHESQEPSEPTFLWNWNGTHTFSWKSKHACPKTLPALPMPQPVDLDPDPVDRPPPDPESDSDESEDLNPPQPLSKISNIFWLFILCTFVLVILFPCFLRRRRFILWTSKFTFIHARSRPSPSRLLRWAQQAGDIDEDEPDFMVNSNPRDYDYGYDEGGGEEMPLTPSPRGTFGFGTVKHGGRYGSTDSTG